ncbi:MAG: recombination mediator RecR [Patescibacteria group bacterium]
MFYPKDIKNLIDEFSKFPGIGPKSAQRFVFYLLRKNPEDIEKLVLNLKGIKNIHICSVCGNFSDQNICSICQDKNRDHSVVAIIAEPQDLMAIEKTGEYQGTYHVLGGLIDMVENKSPEQIKIKELLTRLKNSPIKELIFALNATIEGESTILYITNLIKEDKILNSKIKLTRIARGLPLGGELEYADEITLTEALKGRRGV